MTTPQNFYPNQQQLRMLQANPSLLYSRDGRDPSHTSYQQSPQQRQFPQMTLPPFMANSMQPKGILRNSYQPLNNINNYQNNDMIRSLMAQLREKEAELAKYKVTYNEFQKVDQTNRGLKSKLDAQTISMAEKDKKITMLVGKLNLEKRSNGSAVADAISDTKIKRLNEQLEEIKIEIKLRDDEIARLNAHNKVFMTRAVELQKMASFQASSHLEEELTTLKEKFDKVNEQNSTCKNTIEELVKRVKAKEWIINSLKNEGEEQRNRESRLNAQVNALKQTVESYNAMFGGKDADVDVPMLLAKLADYETQALQFQKQQQQKQKQQLTSSSDDRIPQAKTVDFKKSDDDGSVSFRKWKSDEGTIVSNDDTMDNTMDDQDDDEDDGTFVTMKTVDDTTYAPTTASAKYKCIDDFNPTNSHAYVFNDLIEDVKEGIQSFQSDGVCGGVNDCYDFFSEEPSCNKEDSTSNASMLETLLGL